MGVPYLAATPLNMAHSFSGAGLEAEGEAGGEATGHFEAMF